MKGTVWTWRLLLFITLAFICISYSNTLNSPLVLDDRDSFVEIPNVFIDDFSIASLSKLANTRFGKRRLIPLATFALDHRLSGGSITQYHVTNITIHLLAAVSLYFFLSALFQTEAASRTLRFIKHKELFCLIVVAFWGLHPVQTNAVTYLVQRMTALAALFYILSLAFYVMGRLKRQWIAKCILFGGCVLSAIAAFLSKEISATLPLMILLIECTFLSPGLFGRILRRIKWYHYVGVFVVLLLLAPLLARPWQEMVLGGYQLRHFSLEERLLTELRIVVFYLSLLVLPLPGRMNLDHDFPVSQSLFSPPSTIASLFVLCFFLYVAFKYKNRYPLIALGIFWFFLTLVIESTVIPLELIFEHRLYLPSIGFFIALMGCADALLSKPRSADSRQAGRIFTLAVIIIACFLSIATTLRNNDWRDEYTIYNDMRRKSPNKVRVHTNVSRPLVLMGRYDEAIAAQKQALALGTGFQEEAMNAANNIMVVLMAQEEYEQAISHGEEFLKAMNSSMDFRSFPKFMYNLGNCYFKTGEYDRAMACYWVGLRERPQTFFMIAGNIEQTLLSANKEERFRKQLGLGGEKVDVYLYMIENLLHFRMYTEANTVIQKSLRDSVDHRKLSGVRQQYEELLEKNNRAAAMSDIENDEAYQTNGLFRVYIGITDFIFNNYPPLVGKLDWLLDRAEQLEPGNPFVSLYRIRLHRKLKQLPAAINEIEKVLPAFPDFPPFLEQAYGVYIRTGQRDKAIIVLKQLIDIFPKHPYWKKLDNLRYSFQIREQSLNVN